MDVEITTLNQNKTRIIIELLTPTKKTIGSKLYKIKCKFVGSVKRYSLKNIRCTLKLTIARPLFNEIRGLTQRYKTGS